MDSAQESRRAGRDVFQSEAGLMVQEGCQQVNDKQADMVEGVFSMSWGRGWGFGGGGGRGD